METLLKNPAFWAGEIGLLLIVICALVANEMTKATSKWWYQWSLYAVAVAALTCMGYPAVDGKPLPTPVYLLMLMAGVVFLAAYFQRRMGTGDPVGGPGGPMVHRIFLVGGIAGPVLLLIVSLIVAFNEQKAATDKLIETTQQQHEETVQIIAADTATKAELRQTLDTVRGQLSEAEIQTAKAKRERDALRKQQADLKRDTEALKAKQAKEDRQTERKAHQLPDIKNIHAKDTLKDAPKKKWYQRIFSHTAFIDTSANVARHIH